MHTPPWVEHLHHCGSGRGSCTYRNWEDEVWVPSKICNVSVEWDPLLGCSSLAHSQGYAQDGIGPKLGWRKQAHKKGESFSPENGVISSNVLSGHPKKNQKL